MLSQDLELSDGKDTVAVLVVGIDPGTTSTKISFLRAFETCEGDKIELTVDPRDQIHVIGSYPGQRESHASSLPTCLVYSESGRLVHWGWDAVNAQSKNGFDPHRLIANWKLRLLEGTLKNPLGKSPKDFTTDFFRALTDHLFHEPRSTLLSHFGGTGGLAQFTFIDILIAMPPGWPHEEHTLFGDAAKIALEGIAGVRVSMVSETECALRSWQSQEGKYGKIKDGEKVILVDLGGGTACLSSFLYEGEGDRWAHLESYSLRAGSEVAAAAFQRDLTTRLRLIGFQESSTILHHALKEFAIRKTEIGTDDEDDFWLCPVEGLKYSERYAFRDGKMLFTRERLRSYFHPLQTDILEKIDDMVTRIRPKHCVLVGSYSRNELFLKQFEKHNERYGMKISRPPNQAEVVATGACRMRVEGDIRLIYGSKVSVGIMTFREWGGATRNNPDVHHFHLDGDERKYWCRVITWIVKKGDTVDPDTAIIDYDGRMLRKRHLQSLEDLVIDEVFLTIEAHPGKDQFTVLKYGTDDAGWQKNKQDFKEKFEAPLFTRSFKLDLTQKLVQKKGKSKVAMKNADFKRDSTGRYFEYKYYLNLSQTDCRISLQVFSRTGQTGKMLLQYSISAFEVESGELQDEQRFAKQISQIENTGKISEESSAGGHAASSNRRSQRVGVDPYGTISSPYASGIVLRDERQGFLDQNISVIPAVVENIHHLRQVFNLPRPALSNAEALSMDVGVLQQDQSDANTNLPDIESENWNIAKNALNWLNYPNQGEGSTCISEGYVDPTTGRSRRKASACKNTPNPAYIVTTSRLHDNDMLQVPNTLCDDENDLDYDPGRKYHKKHTMPLSKQSAPKSKKIRKK